MVEGNAFKRNLGLAELAVAVGLAAAVLALLVVRATHAGALWRDEAGALQLATLPSFGEVARNFQHEAFPLLFSATLRFCSHVFGASDAALRSFGFFVGVGFVAAAWLVVASKEKPLLVLGLVGLNSTFLIWGTTVRGYGIGSVLILITFAFALRALRQPTPVRILVATFAAMASTHYLLHNLTLIAAMAVAAIVVLCGSGRPKPAMIVFALALICAASMLPYAPNYLGAEWQKVLRVPVGFGWLGRAFLVALGQPGWLMRSLWLGAAILFLGAAVARLRSNRFRQSHDAVVASFVVIFAVVAPIFYFVFLQALSYPTHSWYYLALITALAASIDFVTSLGAAKWTRIVRLTIATAALCVIPLGTFKAVTERQSNMIDVAQKISEARAEDLILVNPWFLAPSFMRYYHGRVPWLTIPMISETRFHRFDLIESRMAESEPLADIENQIRQTLISGRRIWLVGGALLLPSGTKPVLLKPAPDPEFGWSADAYTTAWSQQIGSFLQAHNGAATVVLAPEEEVNAVENIPVWMIERWRE